MDSFHKHTVIGSGQKIMVAFVGFAQEADELEDWVDELPDYTVYFIDWDDKVTDSSHDTSLSAEDWLTAFKAFLDAHKINKFEMLGFSLGTRLALEAASALNERVDRLWLLAPLGVIRNYWYSLATRWPGRGIFRYFLDKPEKLVWWANRLLAIRGISSGMARVVRLYSKDKKALQRVYQAWQFCRKFSSRGAIWARLSDVPLMLVAGKDDFIFTPSCFHEASRELNLRGMQVESLELDCGHNQLIRALAEWLADVPDLPSVPKEQEAVPTASDAHSQSANNNSVADVTPKENASRNALDVRQPALKS